MCWVDFGVEFSLVSTSIYSNTCGLRYKQDCVWSRDGTGTESDIPLSFVVWLGDKWDGIVMVGNISRKCCPRVSMRN
jgi:hypothetical protein